MSKPKSLVHSSNIKKKGEKELSINLPNKYKDDKVYQELIQCKNKKGEYILLVDILGIISDYVGQYNLYRIRHSTHGYIAHEAVHILDILVSENINIVGRIKYTNRPQYVYVIGRWIKNNTYFYAKSDYHMREEALYHKFKVKFQLIK